ncbi:hypothetical protein GWN26_11695, partial [Candidatus Saccharibacteria bacterium]|nr:hypothetical protein [Candidatus Saccharibacteria bacterium]NIV04164.1 hypothetical protein [Calditrichia bacterium]NIV72427.1 hypothetical protein [Calditrichia bacterium]NIV99743.1 hypothetical protein [Candidatus Saccharibacteria bacterium]NIW79799.1 hypothetical protein [Calditrichia bacterium]
IYGTYKDGAPHNYSPHTIFRWWERMEKLGVSIPFHKHQLHKTYHENAISVAASEGIRFVVYDKRVVTFDGQALYENQRFGILDLELSLDARFSFL